MLPSTTASIMAEVAEAVTIPLTQVRDRSRSPRKPGEKVDDSTQTFTKIWKTSYLAIWQNRVVKWELKEGGLKMFSNGLVEESRTWTFQE